MGKAIKTTFLRQIHAVETPLVGQNLQDTCRMILEVTQIATAIVRGQEHGIKISLSSRIIHNVSYYCNHLYVSYCIIIISIAPGRDQTDEMLPYSMMQDAAIKTAVESI